MASELVGLNKDGVISFTIPDVHREWVEKRIGELGSKRAFGEELLNYYYDRTDGMIPLRDVIIFLNTKRSLENYEMERSE